MKLWRRGQEKQHHGPRWVILTMARHQPEADLLVNVLRDSDIPAYHRRGAGFDVPDFLAVGPRDIMVPEDRLQEARVAIDPGEWRAAPGAAGEPAPSSPAP